jgi:hypothetical protein
MSIGRMIAGIGLLIGMYLFLSNSDATTKIISTFAENSVRGIKTLQGR